MAKRGSSSLNPDYYGGMSAAAATGKGKGGKGRRGRGRGTTVNVNVHGGGGGSGGSGGTGSGAGKGKGGRGGGGSLTAPISSKNEAAARDATTHGIRSGTQQAIFGRPGKTPGLKGGEKEFIKDYGNARETLAGGLTQARSDITGARDTALGYYKPYADASAGAASLYGGSIGLGGQAGHDAAVKAFQTGPGYEFAMGQGLTNIDRQAASRGELGGGGNNADAIRYSQGLANQEYGGWQDRLANEQAFGAGIAQQQAGLQTGAGTQLANAGLNTAGTTANLWQAQGGQEYDYAKDIANLEQQRQMGLGAAQADFQLSKNQTGANIYGLGTGLIQTGATAGGYGGYGNPAFSSPRTTAANAYTPPSSPFGSGFNPFKPG